jgi:hypothetical protein
MVQTVAGELRGRCGTVFVEATQSCLRIEPLTDRTNPKAIIDFYWNVMRKFFFYNIFYVLKP